MKLRIVCALLLTVLSAACWSQSLKIQSGSTVYINPLGGYEAYLVAALVKEHVPLIVVNDKQKARYIITSTVAQRDFSADDSAIATRNKDAAAFNENAQTSIALFDPNVSQILFACAADKVGADQLEKTAEDCAKHMEKVIQKSTQLTGPR